MVPPTPYVPWTSTESPCFRVVHVVPEYCVAGDVVTFEPLAENVNNGQAPLNPLTVPETVTGFGTGLGDGAGDGDGEGGGDGEGDGDGDGEGDGDGDGEGDGDGDGEGDGNGDGDGDGDGEGEGDGDGLGDGEDADGGIASTSMRVAVSTPPSSRFDVRTDMPTSMSVNASGLFPKLICVSGRTRMLRPATIIPSDEMPLIVPLTSTAATAASADICEDGATGVLLRPRQPIVTIRTSVTTPSFFDIPIHPFES